MSKYVEIACGAARLARVGTDPRAAWEEAPMRAYPISRSAREKSCPRCAYLGLAEVGLVLGVRRGDCTRSLANKQYAMDAIEHLAAQPDLSNRPLELWRRVIGDGSTKRNDQMIVVVALWKNGDIIAATL